MLSETAIFLTTVKHYFQYFWSLLINMEHNLYDDTDDYYDDDSDTLIMDLSDICDKLYDSEEENDTPRLKKTHYF